jgi:transcriptional regulator with XRE-family HTH domain
MLHDEVKQARIEAGLSQVELARRAGVQRKQVQQLESGANVTLGTIRQILPALPNLKRVTLGGLAIEVANVDIEEARRAAWDMFDAMKRLLSALGAAPPVPAERNRATVTERETAERIERRIPELKQPKRKGQA